MGVRRVKDESDLCNLLTHSSDVFLHFHEKKRGRPPKLQREHVEAMIILCKTLIDDIHKSLDYMLPDLKQVNDLINAFEYLNNIKRRYINRVNYLEKYGLIPPAEDKNDD